MKAKAIREMSRNLLKSTWHVISLPSVGEKGFYRETVSYNSFFFGRSSNTELRTFLPRCEHEIMEMKKLLDIENFYILYGEYEKALNEIEPVSIWQFYENIGYDRKNKKYASKEKIRCYLK